LLLASTALFLAFGPPANQTLAIGKGDLAGLTEVQAEDAIDVPPRISGANQLGQWCVKEFQTLQLRAAPPQAMRAYPYPLVGIARANFCGRWVAVLRYPSASVFAWPQQQIKVNGLGSSPRQIHQTRDLTVAAWVEGDTVYVAVFKGGIPKEWERQDRPGLT
jgi:hypothetical protein